MRVNEQRVRSDVEVLVLREPVRTGAVEIYDARKPSASDDVMPRNFTACLAYEKGRGIDVEIGQR